jgi:hypothetical protein
MNSRAPVCVLALGMNMDNSPPELLIFLGTFAGLPMTPGVIACSCHSVEPAHDRHGVPPPVLLDVLEDFCLRSEVNRMAFFKRVCSS